MKLGKIEVEFKTGKDGGDDDRFCELHVVATRQDGKERTAFTRVYDEATKIHAFLVNNEEELQCMMMDQLDFLAKSPEEA